MLPTKPSKRKARLENQPRRPPNAFILYRKDKHPELKKMYPEIHNNEICKFYSESIDDDEMLIKISGHGRQHVEERDIGDP